MAASPPTKPAKTQLKIKTPDSNFKGTRLGVIFSGGVGYTANTELRAQFKNLYPRYKVSIVKQIIPPNDEAPAG